jgi:hypothetical protein
MSTPVLTYSTLVAEAGVLLDEAALRPGEVVTVHLLRSAEALCRCATLVTEVRLAARDALDAAPVDTRRRPLEAVRDFEIGEQYERPSPAPLDLGLEGRP